MVTKPTKYRCSICGKEFPLEQFPKPRKALLEHKEKEHGQGTDKTEDTSKNNDSQGQNDAGLIEIGFLIAGIVVAGIVVMAITFKPKQDKILLKQETVFKEESLWDKLNKR